jgi:DNA processing protein
LKDSILHQIALTLVPQVGAVMAKTLVSYCGSAEAVFRASRKELLKIPNVGTTTADFLAQAEPLHRAEVELAFIENHNIVPIFYTHPSYPARLKQCHDCPALLFFKGSDVALLAAERVVGIVGTRQPTEYGKAICEEIIQGLQSYNVLIVSGLAYGVDVTAHRKSNQINMPNIGVLGHGLGSIYPTAHRSIAAQMIENGGLLSEYISTAGPDREHFPMRNRIIAGLCDALVVVETAASGGSMITAGLAASYEREIFALPGRVQDAKSMGCNQLIKNGTAKLIENAQDLAQNMQWTEAGKPRAIQAQLLLDLSAAEMRIVDIVRRQPEIAIDQLTLQTEMSPGELASLILGLEFRGILKTLPGKRYLVL